MTNEAVFFSGQTAQRAKKYRSEEMDASASLSSKMPYMLNASRFAHYIKVIMRDKIGSFQSSKNVESYLQAWIAEYVLLSDGATQEMKAEYPLREAQIKVQESEMLGEYSVTLNMRPHFQMEGLNVCLRFVAKILSGD
jgi:type VI secretion system protein ImpC